MPSAFSSVIPMTKQKHHPTSRVEPEMIKAQKECLLRVRALNNTIDKYKNELAELCVVGAQV